MRLGDSRLQSLDFKQTSLTGCDLRLGDSRLQYLDHQQDLQQGCDLRLGDSRLQYVQILNEINVVVICV